LNIEAPGYQIFGAGTDDEKIKGVASSMCLCKGQVQKW